MQLKPKKSSNVAAQRSCVQTVASVLHDRTLLLFCRRFEDVGSVVLQLFNALPDVVQRSEGETEF